MKNYELSNDQKISTPYIFVILQGTLFTHVPRRYLGQINREKLSHTEVSVLR